MTSWTRRSRARRRTRRGRHGSRTRTGPRTSASILASASWTSPAVRSWTPASRTSPARRHPRWRSRRPADHRRSRRSISMPLLVVPLALEETDRLTIGEWDLLASCKGVMFERRDHPLIARLRDAGVEAGPFDDEPEAGNDGWALVAEPDSERIVELARAGALVSSGPARSPDHLTSAHGAYVGTPGRHLARDAHRCDGSPERSGRVPVGSGADARVAAGPSHRGGPRGPGGDRSGAHGGRAPGRARRPPPAGDVPRSAGGRRVPVRHRRCRGRDRRRSSSGVTRTSSAM